MLKIHGLVPQLNLFKNPYRSARKVLPSSVEIIVADVTKPASIKPAFHNASVIYHCVNVPYDKWTELMPLVTDSILASAIEKQANVIFPGNVYVYGRFQRIPATEDHPLAATAKKGKLRIALEKKLMDARISWGKGLRRTRIRRRDKH